MLRRRVRLTPPSQRPVVERLIPSTVLICGTVMCFCGYGRRALITWPSGSNDDWPPCRPRAPPLPSRGGCAPGSGPAQNPPTQPTPGTSGPTQAGGVDVAAADLRMTAQLEGRRQWARALRPLELTPSQAEVLRVVKRLRAYVCRHTRGPAGLRDRAPIPAGWSTDLSPGNSSTAARTPTMPGRSGCP